MLLTPTSYPNLQYYDVIEWNQHITTTTLNPTTVEAVSHPRGIVAGAVKRAQPRLPVTAMSAGISLLGR